ncbi:MAG: hypothetical protein ACLSHG_11210 [Oscillospiraceae bacterium]
MIFAMRSQKQPWTRRTSRSPRRTRTLTRDNYNTAGTWPELTQSAGAPG